MTKQNTKSRKKQNEMPKIMLDSLKDKERKMKNMATMKKDEKKTSIFDMVLESLVVLMILVGAFLVLGSVIGVFTAIMLENLSIYGRLMLIIQVVGFISVYFMGIRSFIIILVKDIDKFKKGLHR